MANAHFNQQPNLDLNTLDENFEIRMEYDQNGNLTRIRKVRRNAGCAFWIAFFLIVAMLAGAWYLFS